MIRDEMANLTNSVRNKNHENIKRRQSENAILDSMEGNSPRTCGVRARRKDVENSDND